MVILWCDGFNSLVVLYWSVIRGGDVILVEETGTSLQLARAMRGDGTPSQMRARGKTLHELVKKHEDEQPLKKLVLTKEHRTPATFTYITWHNFLRFLVLTSSYLLCFWCIVTMSRSS